MNLAPSPRYVTLESAAKKLQCENDDILYYIEKSMLRCTVFVRHQRLLITSDRGIKPVKGFASCSYRGLLEPMSTTIVNNLIDTDSFIVGVCRFKLLEPEGISHWSRNEPFNDTSTRPNLFDKWQPIERGEFNPDEHHIFFMPSKNDDPTIAQAISARSTQEMNAETDIIDPHPREPNSKYIYMFDTSQSLKKTDLRILVEDIELIRLGRCRNPASHDDIETTIDIEDRLITKRRKRVYSHHVVIERALLLTSIKTAAQIWRAIKQESESDPFSKQFDKEGVILEVGHDHLYWRSRNQKDSKELSISYNRFENLITELKKAHKIHV